MLKTFCEAVVKWVSLNAATLPVLFKTYCVLQQVSAVASEALLFLTGLLLVI